MVELMHLFLGKIIYFTTIYEWLLVTGVFHYVCCRLTCLGQHMQIPYKMFTMPSNDVAIYAMQVYLLNGGFC